MSSKVPKVLIFGTGSVGAIYAFILSRGGCHVTTVCRTNYLAVKENGIKIESQVFGSQTFKPHEVVDHAPKGFYDFIIVTAKSFPRSGQAELLDPSVTPEKTTIVLIQNGIEIEIPYQERFPENPIISCVVYLPVTQISPGHIVHKETERLIIGTYPHTAPESHKDRVSQFGTLIRDGGATVEVQDDVQATRWQKLMLNAAWNPICALTRSRDAEFLSLNSSGVHQPALELVADVMREVALVATASGYPSLNEQKIEATMSSAKARITGKKDQGVEVSMMADVLQGRQMEVDAIVSNVVGIAEKLGLGEKVPLLRMLWLLTEALNNSPRR